jgi:hypothetical protein
MDNFFVNGNLPQNGFTHVTILGVALICVVLLVLFYYLVCKKQFVLAPSTAPAVASYTNPNAQYIRTGVGLRLQQQDQVNVGRGGAGFQGGPESPVFWGVSGCQDLASEQVMNIGAEGAVMNASSASAGFHGHGKAGFTDDFLLNGPAKGR